MKTPVFAHSGRAADRRDRCRGTREAFTLIELLVVIAIIAILAAILLPVLEQAKVRGEAALSLSNTRQLTLGWLMYPDDNNGKFVSYTSWVFGTMDWTSSSDNTNTLLLVGPIPNQTAQPLLGPYIKNPRVFKSPADNYQSPKNPGPRVRSYSMNGALGGGSSGPTVQGTSPADRQYFGSDSSSYGEKRDANKSSDLRLPADTFVMVEEQSDSINDGAFMFDPGYARGQEHWRDLPASIFDGDGCLSFADGHSELHKWLERGGNNSTIYPVTFQSYPDSADSPWGKKNLGVSRDYEWMNDHMPYAFQ